MSRQPSPVDRCVEMVLHGLGAVSRIVRAGEAKHPAAEIVPMMSVLFKTSWRCMALGFWATDGPVWHRYASIGLAEHQEGPDHIQLYHRLCLATHPFMNLAAQ